MNNLDTKAVECVNEISHMTWNNSATFQAKLVPIIARYLKQAREEGGTAAALDCRAGAHLIHECAVKAAQRIKGPTFSALKDPEEIMAEHQTLVNIICEAFGAPVKDECQEAFDREWEKHDPYSHPEPGPTVGESYNKAVARKMFTAAWKLAKGKP